MAKNILIVALIITIIAICYQLFFNNPKPDSREINIKNLKFNLEVAITIPQKTKGLMDRTTLCQNCGMIFVSSFEMPQIFWMKDTKIPLDMVFLDKNGTVINIETAIPEPNVSDSNLKLYKSLQPSKYVIELNAGTSSQISLLPGDKIDLSIFP